MKDVLRELERRREVARMGGGKTRIEMWDGTKWVPQTDWFSAYDDVVWEVVKQQSAEFAKTTK